MSRVRPVRLGLAVVTLGAVALATACSGSSTTPSATSSSAGADAAYSERGPITFARAKDNTGYAPKEVAAWNAEHPDEQVTLLDLPDSADQQRQQIIQGQQVKADTMTVVTTDVVWTAEFGAKGYVDELPADKFDLSGYLPATVKSATYFDKLYGVPGDSNGGLLYYRSDLLEKAGVEVPTTWAEMKAACAAVAELPEADGVDCYGGQFDKYEGLTVAFAEAVDSSGGSIIGADGQPTVDTPEAAAGLNFLADSFDDGTIPKGAITWKEEESRQAFQSGKLLFLRNWPYVYGLAGKTDGSSEVAGKFDVAPLPGLDGPGISSLGGLNFAITKYGRNKATAVDFINFLSSAEEQKQRALASANPPVLESLYADPEMVEKFPYLPTLKDSIANAKPRPQAVQYGDVTIAIQDAVYGTLNDQTQGDAALATLQGKLAELVQ